MSSGPWGGRRAQPPLVRWGIRLVLPVVAVVLGGLVFDRVVMPIVVRHGQDTTVPPLRGRTRDESLRALRDLRLQAGQVLEVEEPSTPEGQVINQDPPPGARVRKGRRVHLIVSGGAGLRIVPGLEGQSMRAARIALSREGLEAGNTFTLPSDLIPAGDILGSRPAAGAEAPKDGKVDFLVSGGAQRMTYLMPDLRGMTASAAASLLRSVGIRVVDESVGTILEQSPTPGAPIRTGDSATFH